MHSDGQRVVAGKESQELLSHKNNSGMFAGILADLSVDCVELERRLVCLPVRFEPVGGSVCRSVPMSSFHTPCLSPRRKDPGKLDSNHYDTYRRDHTI